MISLRKAIRDEQRARFYAEPHICQHGRVVIYARPGDWYHPDETICESGPRAPEPITETDRRSAPDMTITMHTKGPLFMDTEMQDTEMHDGAQPEIAVEDRFPKLARKLRARAEQDPEWADYMRATLEEASPTDQGEIDGAITAAMRDDATAQEIFASFSSRLVDWGQQTEQGMALTALAVMQRIGEFAIGVTQDVMRDDYADRLNAADNLVAIAHEISKVGVTGGLSSEQLDKLNEAIDDYDEAVKNAS